MNYTVYTDGACSGNGKENASAGWGYVILDGKKHIIEENSGHIPNGTNNIGELTAILEALKSLSKMTCLSATIFSDSAYCINGLNNWRFNWKKNDWWRDKSHRQVLKNKELWQSLDEYIEKSPAILTFSKVSGHSGVKWNEYVDKLAVKAKEE